jgi:DNA gyrase subunit B
MQADGTEISNQTLTELARQYQACEAMIERLSRFIDQAALHAIVNGIAINLENEQQAQQSAENLEAALASSGEIEVSVQSTDEGEKFHLRIARRLHGNVRLSKINSDFVVSNDYQALRDYAKIFSSLLSSGAKVIRGTGDKLREQKVSNLGYYPKQSAASVVNDTKG